jgi:hypothetical protein
MEEEDVVKHQIKNTPVDILAELQRSVLKNNAVGIIVKDTKELITTAVVEIKTSEGAEDSTIILRDQDLHGYPLERKNLLLSNIDKVIHFNIAYDDPQYVKVRRKEKFKV